MQKGFLLFVYRNGSDCTNRGISSKTDTVNVTSSEVELPEIFKVSEDEHMKLIMRNVGTPFPILVPKDAGPDGSPYMFGGNFAYTSDSRFPFDAPVKIFDRKENQPVW